MIAIWAWLAGCGADVALGQPAEAPPWPLRNVLEALPEPVAATPATEPAAIPPVAPSDPQGIAAEPLQPPAPGQSAPAPTPAPP